MKKKTAFTLLALLLAASLTLFAVALADAAPEAEPVQLTIQSGTYEGDELEDVAEAFGYDLETEDGYTLESITVAYAGIDDGGTAEDEAVK